MTNPNHFVSPFSNGIRGDHPNWQVPPIPESATQAALLHLVQCQLRAAEIEAAIDSEPEPEPPRRKRPKWARAL